MMTTRSFSVTTGTRHERLNGTDSMSSGHCRSCWAGRDLWPRNGGLRAYKGRRPSGVPPSFFCLRVTMLADVSDPPRAEHGTPTPE